MPIIAQNCADQAPAAFTNTSALTSAPEASFATRTRVVECARSMTLILDDVDAERLRLALEALQQAVGIAPAVLRRMHTAAEIVDGHRREPRLELPRRQELDFTPVPALNFEVRFQ